MDELTLDNQKYLSSKQAAKVTGYAKDYVGQLCREGRVAARLVGRNWYVLESSILEHRFGAEEAEGAPEVVPVEPVNTWQAPRYTSESVSKIPELTPKPYVAPIPEPEVMTEPVVVPISAQMPAPNPVVLADMQAAWQEWFQKEEKNLPEPSEMLLEDEYADAPVNEEVGPTQEVEQPVHIDRVSTEREEPTFLYKAEILAEKEEAIPISRSYAPRKVERPIAPPMPTATLARRQRVIRRRRRSGAGGNFIVQSFFIALAGLAVAIAVIGSGLADSALGATGSGGTFITDFLSGTHTYNK